MKDKEKEKEKKQLQSNILVAIRVRPLNQKQLNSGDWDIIRTQDNLIIILDPIQKQFEMQNKKMLDVLHRSKEQRYAFDKIYRDQPSQKIYQQTAKPLIKTVVTGKNATVFAYGPTGTGKTYTMLGNQDTYGLNVLAIRDIFHLIQQDSQYDYTVNITYVEIYNEMIRDLLVPSSGYLQLRDDSDKGITIAGVTQFKAESTEQVMNLLMMGNKRRTTEATNANQTSSRSHAVFQITVIKTPRTKNTSVETLIGKLSLIDLAGSERGTATENRGIRLMEGAKINRSLLALANCINALGDKNKKGFFVPYRDSKLTRLLKDSLGGNCKTVMIANICPAGSQFQQTINTLKYANRAKNIKTKALTNKKLVSIHISEYKNIINDLRQQIQQLKLKLQKNGTNENAQFYLQSNSVQNSNQACTCGKIQQAQEIKKIKQTIFENFNERIQLRRQLMEIEEQNAINILQIRKRQGQIMLLKKNQINQETAQGQKAIQQIKSLTRTINTLKLSTQKNILKKQIINLRLMQSMSATKKIKQQIPKRVKSKQNRQFLEIIIKNHVLQLQNIELQINLQIQQKILVDLKNISDSQRKSLQQKGIDLTIDDMIGENDEIELQIEDDQDNQQGEQVQQNNIIQAKQIVQQDYKEDFQEEEQLQTELIENKFINKNKSQPNNSGKGTQQDERKNKMRPLENSNNIQLGIVGLNNAKKKQKNVISETKLPVNTKNVYPPVVLAQKEISSSDNILDLNLKGTNLKLNQKLPFVMVPKEKKKK